jgi:hypothetical protein
MRPRLLLPTIGLLLFSTFSSAQTPGAQDPAGQPRPAARFFTKDMTVYVSDFELNAQNVEVDRGGIAKQALPGILQTPRQQQEQDAAAQARKLVNLMSANIVADLRKSGYQAQRLSAGDPLPVSGAWVHGEFTEVSQGSRAQRAVIGFGSGAAKMNLLVTLADLASPERALSLISQNGTSGKKPGAALSLNPYAAAAKFVLEKNAPEKTVKKTASKISANIVKELREHQSPLPTQ